MPRPTLDLSVIIPTYNRPNLLPQTIRSVLDQSCSPREIIVVDNDPGGSAAAAVAAFGSEVMLIREPIPGQQAARNAGIRAASSEWVTCLDDDDLYCPGFLEIAAEIMEDGRATVIGCDHRKFLGSEFERQTNFEMAPAGYWDGIPRPEDGRIWSFVDQFPLDRLLRRIPLYPSMTIVRSDLVRTIGGYDTRLRGIVAEDIEFLVRLLATGHLALIWQPMVWYRLHEGNDSRGEHRQTFGRWEIFEFIRREHKNLPSDFIRHLDEDLLKRRRLVFDTAFHVQDLDVMKRASGLLRMQDWTIGRRIRQLLSLLPGPIVRALRHGRARLRG